MQAPSGTVTFLFTDIVGSTRLWDAEPEAMSAALARHDAILRSNVEATRGWVFSTGGDGFAAAFSRAGDALDCAQAAQVALIDEPWPDAAMIRVRMGLHTGEAEERDGDYFGSAVNRAARLMAVAHGGQVVCSDVTVGLVGVDGRFVDLGEHRLRDLSEPQRVFQLQADGLPDHFPSLLSVGSYPGNLPLTPSRFVGRAAAVRAVANALEESQVVTVTGVGGVGKTRLAIQVAAEVVPAFPDGAWLAELGGVGDPEAVEEVVATALGVHARPGQPLRVSLIDALRARRLLLLVDNCEHLVTAVAELVEQIVAECSAVQVLATSREGLAVAGERVVPLAPMQPPTGEDLDVAAQSEAVQLLIDRVADVRPGFALTSDNAAALGRLCRRLDGIPLALELAAARLRSLSPEDVLDHLDQRFRFLTGGRRTALSRQQTLRGAIDWSFELLDDTERTVLRRLGVFAGGFDLATAQQVASGGEVETYDVADLVDRLVDKSLVSADLTASRPRYRLLETIRDYAWERLAESGETDAVSLRHAEWFHAFVVEADERLRGPDEAEWTDRLELELENVRAALAWAVDSGRAELALGIVGALTSGFGNRIGAPFGPLAERAAAMSGADALPMRCVALASAARSEAQRGNVERAQALADDAVAEAAKLPNDEQATLARCRAISGVAAVVGPHAPRERMLQLADLRLQAANDVGDPWERSRALMMFASLHLDEPEGIAAGEESIRLARQIGNPTGIAFALGLTAPAVAGTDPQRAIAMLEEATNIATDADNAFAVLMAQQTLGRLHAMHANSRAAMRAFSRAAEIGSSFGDRSYLWGAIACIACGLADTGAPEDAVLLALAAVHHMDWPDDFEALPLMVATDSLTSARAALSPATFERLRADAAMLDEVSARRLASECIATLGDG